MLSIKINRRAVSSMVAVICLGISAHTFANEGAEGGAEGGEKKKVEKKEKSPAIEFIEKTTKLNTIQVRLSDADKDFDKIVEEKDREQDQKKKDEMIKELIAISTKRNKDVEDFNRIKQELLYQYPAKAAELNGLYQTQEKKSVDEMTGAADIDDLLTRAKKVIDRKFGPLNPDNDKPKPATKTTAKEEPPPKLRLEK